MSRYAAVAIGYSRDKSMQRLLFSLEEAYYDEECDLIISIDNSGADNVEQCAYNFQWSHGKKKVVTYPERQGLRKHILQCGDFLQEYDAIAVLEDDVIVAPGFFQFMKEAVEQYKGDIRIAGISLYNHLWNVVAKQPFDPAYSPYDAYFLQFAQSWGQVWLKHQWEDFIKWYLKNCEEFGQEDSIPINVSSWPRTSWLKYHIKYCIMKNKYFVYPYKALSTCFSDIGEHNNSHITVFQIPMLSGVKKNYYLPLLDDNDAVIYDAFFERKFTQGNYVKGIDLSDVEMNLYGQKNSSMGKKYIVTPNRLHNKLIASFSLELRPHEENIRCSIPGNDLFLYEVASDDRFCIQKQSVVDFKYRFRILEKNRVMCRNLLHAIKQRLCR